eukprot:5725682-Amphidinium_carterae.1
MSALEVTRKQHGPEAFNDFPRSRGKATIYKFELWVPWPFDSAASVELATTRILRRGFRAEFLAVVRALEECQPRVIVSDCRGVVKAVQALQADDSPKADTGIQRREFL